MRVGGSLREVVEVAGPWRHRQVAANGARFHVAESGDGPLVLLLHGFPEFWWAWRHQIPALAADGWHAAAMDLRGFGGSDKTPRGYDPTTLSSDIAAVVRSLGERRAVLVGHGWGAYVAWAAAVLRPATVAGVASVSMPHPLVLRRAMLTDPRQTVSAGHLLGFQVPVVPERRLVADGGAFVETLLRRWAADGSDFPDAEAAARYRAAMHLWPAPHCALEYHRWAVRSLVRPDGRRFARRMRQRVEQPVLQVHGAADHTVLLRTAAGSADHVSGPYRWSVLEDAGHFPHEEQPARFTEVLLDWLSALPR